jgi:hypothetical protein
MVRWAFSVYTDDACVHVFLSAEATLAGAKAAAVATVASAIPTVSCVSSVAINRNSSGESCCLNLNVINFGLITMHARVYMFMIRWRACGCCHGRKQTSTPPGKPSSSPQLLGWPTSSLPTRRSCPWRGSTPSRAPRSTSRTPLSRAPPTRLSSGHEEIFVRRLPPLDESVTTLLRPVRLTSALSIDAKINYCHSLSAPVSHKIPPRDCNII